MKFVCENRWLKKGIIITPDSSRNWMVTHAMLPTLEHLQGNEYRVYFSGRNKDNQSLIGYADITVDDGLVSVTGYSPEPVLGLGERGAFDDNGVTPSCIINTDSEKRLYYIGWNSGTTTTRMGLIAGLATSENGTDFTRYSRAPMLERTNLEPFSILTAPFVIRESQSDWKLYYVSGVDWLTRDLPRYNIKSATSVDGINWKREGNVCIDFSGDHETALARPFVLKDDGMYKMWFSYKDPRIGYRIGYAESADGFDWERMDAKVDLGVSQEGWDSEMICYSYVIKHEGLYYMFYNGNGYGLTGVGYAVSK